MYTELDENLPYKIGILYDNKKFNHYCNAIKFEEYKGNISLIGIRVAQKYADSLDGWKLYPVEELIQQECEYLIISEMGNTFLQMKNMLAEIGFPAERILSIEIFGIPKFDFKEYVELLEHRPSIITNHCWGGFTYHTLQMEFLSPFINLFIENKDYLRLLENLQWYMEQELIFDREEQEVQLGCMYPVGRLADVSIHFKHYKSFEEAKEKWDLRKKRINWQNLFVEMNSSNREEIEQFDRLPFENKVVFIPFSCKEKSALDISMYNNQIKDNIEGLLYQNVNRFGMNEAVFYDILKLLNGKADFLRYQRENKQS